MLVIAPLRVANSSWPDEIAKWDHLKGLTYAIATGSEKDRLRALRSGCDVTIINRENVSWLVRKSGWRPDFDALVIDELSSFKSWSTERFKALMKLRPGVRRVIGLTGTPAPNSLMDLHSEYRILDMGRRLERTITTYRDRYFLPDRRNGNIVYTYRPRPGAEKAIYDRISDITISMRALDHLDMPELVSGRWKVTMSEGERRLYERLKGDMVLSLKGSEVTAANAAVLLQKLTQLSGGAIYGDDGKVVRVHDRKLDALEDIVEAANGRSMLLAYWYTHELERIRERLEKLKVKHEVIDGEDSIRRWNAGEIQVGIVHPASCGHGLNLQTGGSTLVWYSMPWSLELYQQTIGRLWRQGQRGKTVVVQHIVCEGTVDERIMRALEGKEVSQNRLIEAVRAEVG